MLLLLTSWASSSESTACVTLFALGKESLVICRIELSVEVFYDKSVLIATIL